MIQGVEHGVARLEISTNTMIQRFALAVSVIFMHWFLQRTIASSLKMVNFNESIIIDTEKKMGYGFFQQEMSEFKNSYGINQKIPTGQPQRKLIYRDLGTASAMMIVPCGSIAHMRERDLHITL